MSIYTEGIFFFTIRELRHKLQSSTCFSDIKSLKFITWFLSWILIPEEQIVKREQKWSEASCLRDTIQSYNTKSVLWMKWQVLTTPLLSLAPAVKTKCRWPPLPSSPLPPSQSICHSTPHNGPPSPRLYIIAAVRQGYKIQGLKSSLATT